jgi:hypothetical protein
MFSLLMVAIIPVLFVLFAVAMDISQMSGIRDHLQRVVDTVAHEALVQRLSSVDIERSVRSRMAGIRGLAQLVSVGSDLTLDAVELSVRGDYRGVFSQLVENLLGRQGTLIPFQVRSRVRVERSGILLLLDRRVVDPADRCGSQSLRGMGGFVDRLVDSVRGSQAISIVVAVTPGEVEPVDIMAVDGSDHISRCRPRLSDGSLDVQGVAGTTAPLDVWGSALGLSDLVSRELFSRQLESRSVIAIVRDDDRAAGYATLAYQFVDESARAAKMPLNLYVLVADGGQVSLQDPQPGGLFGGVYREVGASLSELQEDALLAVLSRTVRERIVIAF